MRLTLDLVRRAPQITNTLRQREIDLRGLGLTILEERPLLLLNDSFDVLNLSQNPLSRLEYFPGSIGASGDAVMRRLQTLIVHRNRISHVSVPTCAAVLPNIRAFLADHNELAALRDLLFLRQWKKLEILSLEHNPLAQHENEARLRAFVVFLCPTLKLVNYQRVTETDRRNVESMRAEFDQLLKEWQRPVSRTLVSHANNNNNNNDNDNGGCGEKKIRKRGREARAAVSLSDRGGPGAAGSSGQAKSEVDPSAAATTAAAAAAAARPVAMGDGDEEVSAHARLEALEARMAAAETEEELMEIQQEIMELEAAAKQQAKTKRTRTQH